MAMGILGQITNNAAVDEIVYTVPAGKVAVFNIFASLVGSVGPGSVTINDAIITNLHGFGTGSSTWVNIELKSIIGNAGTTVQFQGCTGIVTGYEEDA